MQVRLARVSDAAAIRAIYNAEVVGSTVTFDIVPRTLAQQRRWVEQHQGAHPAVVAVDDDGTLTGFGSLSVFRDRAAYAATVEDSIYVDERCRGRGVGRLLLEELLSLARKQGFHSVVARIADDNAASIALHRRCGFVLVGVEKEVGRKFNRWIDVAVMQLQL